MYYSVLYDHTLSRLIVNLIIFGPFPHGLTDLRMVNVIFLQLNVQGTVIVIIKTLTAVFLFKTEIYTTKMCSLCFGWTIEYSEHIFR